MELMVRFSTKIRQLNEGGLINYWRKKEMAKVARMSTDGTQPIWSICN